MATDTERPLTRSHHRASICAVLLLALTAAPCAAQDEAPMPAAALPPSADFGSVYQGYTVQASFGLDWSAEAGKKVPKTETQGAVKVLACNADRLSVQMDTSKPGPVQARVVVRLGAEQIPITITATVLPAMRTSPSVVLASGPMHARSTDDPARFDTLRKILARGKIQAHQVVEPTAGRWFDPILLQSAQTVLLADSALVRLHHEDELLLQGFVCGGGRLVVCASGFMVGTQPVANRLLAPFGLEIPKLESLPGVGFTVPGSDIAEDPLTRGVPSLEMLRAGTTLLKTEAAHALANADGHALLAVRRLRGGGEIVTLPVPLWWTWIERSPGNARLVRNLLTRPAAPQ